MKWLRQTNPDNDNDLSLVEYFPDVPISTPVAMVSELLMEELEQANNETLPSDSPQGDAKEGDTETSIVLPGEESVETTKKRIHCDGDGTDIDNMVLKEEVSYDIFRSILFNLY